MATYREIIGKKIKKVSSDPSSGIEGEMWYNSTTGTLRGPAILSAWISASPINTARGTLDGTGTQTAALIAAGYTTPPATVYSNTEEYNGSGWSNGGAVNTARRDAALFGTQTSAIAAGGGTPTYTNSSESYNGTAWTAKPNINTTRSLLAGAGASNTSGVIFAGFVPPVSAVTEEWDGSSWTSVNSMNTARHNPGGVGTQTAALAFAGSDPSQSKHTEEYDGTNWTTVNNMPTATGELSGAGIQTSAIGAGGYTTTYSNQSYTYDGTNWSNAPNLAANRTGGGGAGASSSSAIVAGGYTGTAWLGTSEEFNSSTTAFTAGAWASGGAMIQGRRGVPCDGCGTQDAALVAGGNGSHPGETLLNNSESYNGATWSEGNNLNTARSGISGAGTQTAGLCIAGFTGGYPEVAITEKYDGTSWTESGDLSTARQLGGSGGTQTAAIYAGGRNGSPTTYYPNAEYFDGSSWTNAPANMPTARSDGASAGTQTAFFMVGGVIPPGPPYNATATTQEWNGSSWASGGDYPASYTEFGASGTQTASIFYGGNPNIASANSYDGTAFSTSPSLATGRTGVASLHGGSSSATAALAAAGTTGSVSTATEEFTGETETLNIETFTTS